MTRVFVEGDPGGAALLLWGRVPPVSARVNWGRWLADCPVCSSALAVEHLQPRLGAPVWDLDGDRWVRVGWREGCWDCGAQTDVVWPDTRMIEGVERLLGMRPQPHTRNWSAGETLHDLARENAEHGIFSSPALDGIVRPGRELLVVAEGELLLDRLPATPALTSPQSYPRRAIGA